MALPWVTTLYLKYNKKKTTLNPIMTIKIIYNIKSEESANRKNKQSTIKMYINKATTTHTQKIEENFLFQALCFSFAEWPGQMTQQLQTHLNYSH